MQTIKKNELTEVMSLTKTQLKTLVNNGSITVGDTTINYDPLHVLYITNESDEHKGNVETITYDNTTLSDHITEILGYVNTENGGNLININFKLSGAISGQMKSITFNTSTGDISNSSSTVNIVNSGEMLSLTVGAIRNGSTGGKKVTFMTNNDTNTCSFTNIDISNINSVLSAKLSGQEFDYGTNTVIQNYFKDIEISNVALEHLVINYFTI